VRSPPELAPLELELPELAGALAAEADPPLELVAPELVVVVAVVPPVFVV